MNLTTKVLLDEDYEEPKPQVDWRASIKVLGDIARGAVVVASNAAVAISGAVVACVHQDRAVIAIGCGAIGVVAGGLIYKYMGRKVRS